jgi:hypothetical protein
MAAGGGYNGYSVGLSALAMNVSCD